MFDNDVKRIGFACKYFHPDRTLNKKLLEEIERPLNERATTITWLNRQTREVAEQRLWDIMEHNISSLNNLIQFVGGLPNELRMVRLGSGVLPAYTEPSWSYYWQLPDVRRYLESNLARVGDEARLRDVRISMHPGQFTVLASDRDDVVERSIEEYEYHTDVLRYMGYGQQFQDAKCNVHISGRRGPQGIIDVLGRLSPESRNCLTIENDEMSWGIEASLELQKHCALVLDIHHHWVATGEYISPMDDRVLRIKDSWRGVRPVIHYSVSREDYLIDHKTDTKPDYTHLIEQGYKKAKLRAHSDMYWNTSVNEWAIGFAQDFDIMCESKAKQVASIAFYNEMYQQNVGNCLVK
jgi:UV DNA damage repair endonuclease